MPVIGQIIKAAGSGPAQSLSETIKPSPEMPVLIAKRCLRFRHKSATCQACVDACPSDAMRLTGGRIRLNVPSCTACGACSAVCPTDALHMRRPSDEDYEAGLAEAKTSGELVFSCGYAAKKPGIRVNCAGSIELSYFLRAAAEGVRSVKLVCGDCAKCPRRQKEMNLSETAQTLGELAGEVGVPFGVSVERAPKEVDLSRRRWFGGILRRAGSESAGKAVPLDPALARIADEPDRRVPDTRRRLLNSVKVFAAAAPEKTDGSLAAALFAAPKADGDKCTACGICATVCPTEALRVSNISGSFMISCVKTHCVACGLCRDICFMKAITLEPLPRLSEALSETPEVILAKGSDDSEEAYSTWEDRLGGMVDVPVYRT